MSTVQNIDSGARPEQNSSIEIIPNIQSNPFQCFAMTAEHMKQIEEMVYLVDGFIVKGYHTYLFGEAGGGKTTIAFYLAKEILQKFPTMNVVFFYIDGTPTMAKNAMELFIALGLDDRMTITHTGTVNDYIATMQACIDQKTDLSNTFFIFDTFKYLTSDINNKTSNKNAMALIKKICYENGATFLSLGHTNKDGEKHSGTAEIEQDSDAIFRIDSYLENNIATSTIQKGGRCRLEDKTLSFRFTKGDVSSVELLDESIDVAAIEVAISERAKDIAFIAEVKSILPEGVEKSQSEMVTLLEDTGIGRNTLIKKLRYYSQKGEWSIKKGENNALIYFIDYERQRTIQRFSGGEILTNSVNPLNP